MFSRKHRREPMSEAVNEVVRAALEKHRPVAIVQDGVMTYDKAHDDGSVPRGPYLLVPGHGFWTAEGVKRLLNEVERLRGLPEERNGS